MKLANAFNLIELLITLSIISILCLLAMPSYHGYQQRAWQQQTQIQLATLSTCLADYYFEHHQYQGINNLDTNNEHYIIEVKINQAAYMIIAHPKPEAINKVLVVKYPIEDDLA